ncbi:hypothetical protein ABGB16_15165 [Micromonospora sp. B11E3]|uniref:hypothetical protein n=1 Tax=Micromonospora sp. B11E3 TaxID=3153562 RepID=UPI00325D337F
MRRVLALVGLPLLVVAAGCAPASTDPSGGGVGDPASHLEAFRQRAAEVADAWRPGRDWTSGYVPLQDPTVLLGDPGFTPDTEQAFRAGWYREQHRMSAAKPADGTIRFPDGTLTVPLVSALEAYQQLDQGDPPPCPGRPMDPPGSRPKPGSTGGPIVEPGPDGPLGSPSPDPDAPVSGTPASACVPLTVTAVRLGTAPVRTSRGEAQVPAWLFTVEGLTAQVARIAVAPDAVTAAPQAPASAEPAPDGVVGAQDLSAVAGTRLAWRIGMGACDTGGTPLVEERDDVVVVGGAVTRATGICTDQLLLRSVTATLKAPLGARPVLDVVTGAPLVVRPL